MRSRFDNYHSCPKWDRLRFQTNFILPDEQEGEFERCPYCGSLLDNHILNGSHCLDAKTYKLIKELKEKFPETKMSIKYLEWNNN